MQVLAIGCGMSDGLGYGANGRAALITRGVGQREKEGHTWAVLIYLVLSCVDGLCWGSRTEGEGLSKLCSVPTCLSLSSGTGYTEVGGHMRGGRGR